MAGKRITIILLGNDAKKVRQVKVSTLFVSFLFTLFLTLSLCLVWIIRDYQSIKALAPSLSYLKNENQQQKQQLITLVHRVHQISEKMVELKRFDHKLKVMVNLESGDQNTQFLGVGGTDPSILKPEQNMEKGHKKLVRLMHHSLDNLDTEASLQINEKAELYKFLGERKSMLASTPSIWPTRGWISSNFGSRTSPFTEEKEFHRGLDISTRMNTPIISPADGRISETSSNNGLGKTLTISHGQGFVTNYGHLSKVLVKEGEYVKRGQKIALVGNTGRTTGPHLHYEVHLNGVPIDPSHYILN